ncbi:MAG: hypothetical protein IPK79_06975 [Vampirovibrionales bacterium]|nr:hypothetical protein [Vampirovibrionales bacterium]
MKRFRRAEPLVLRPDLLLTDDGFALTEIDSVPGGLGFTAALNAAYRQSGFAVIEAPEGGLPQAFGRLLQSVAPDTSGPSIAIVLSDEAGDYRREMTWLAARMQEDGWRIAVVHPQQLRIVGDHLAYSDESGRETPIQVIYRFFELFDLPQIANIELLRFAVKKGWAACTPPFKPHLEEKLWLALAHHPCLRAHWRALLDASDWHRLQAMIPPSWILDPAPLPPQAVLPGLMRAGAPIQAFSDLAGASQQERALVVKPSGFSPLAWGSRGVSIGHDLPAPLWGERLETALRAFSQTPYVLQAFRKPMAHPAQRLALDTGESISYQGRTRLCPYYFIQTEAQTDAGSEAPPTLAGVLATTCPADKKIIHGMRDAVLAPAMRNGQAPE